VNRHRLFSVQWGIEDNADLAYYRYRQWSRTSFDQARTRCWPPNSSNYTLRHTSHRRPTFCSDPARTGRYARLPGRKMWNTLRSPEDEVPVFSCSDRNSTPLVVLTTECPSGLPARRGLLDGHAE